MIIVQQLPTYQNKYLRVSNKLLIISIGTYLHTYVISYYNNK